MSIKNYLPIYVWKQICYKIYYWHFLIGLNFWTPLLSWIGPNFCHYSQDTKTSFYQVESNSNFWPPNLKFLSQTDFCLQIIFDEMDILFLLLNQNVTTDFNWIYTRFVHQIVMNTNWRTKCVNSMNMSSHFGLTEERKGRSQITLLF